MEAQASTSNAQNQITVERTVGPIAVDHVKKSDFSKPGFLQAQLRQVILTISSYPTTRVGNSLNDALFSTDEFAGIESKVFTNKETRVGWIDVPEGTTVEDVVKRLQQYPNANLYKTLSNSPILTDEQRMAITRGFRTKDFFANKQVVKYGEGATNAQGHDVSGQFIWDPNGNIQYKVVSFSLHGKEDVDLRTTNKEEHYQSAEILAEIKGASIFADQGL